MVKLIFFIAAVNPMNLDKTGLVRLEHFFFLATAVLLFVKSLLDLHACTSNKLNRLQGIQNHVA